MLGHSPPPPHLISSLMICSPPTPNYIQMNSFKCNQEREECMCDSGCIFYKMIFVQLVLPQQPSPPPPPPPLNHLVQWLPPPLACCRNKTSGAFICFCIELSFEFKVPINTTGILLRLAGASHRHHHLLLLLVATAAGCYRCCCFFRGGTSLL